MDETPSAPPRPPHSSPGAGFRRIVREPEDRKIAGVCSGLADHLGIDVTVMRVAAVALALITPAALIAYLVAAVALPERRADQPRVQAHRVHLGQVPHPLVVVGAIVAVAVLIDDAWWLDPFPAAVALVGVGVWLVVQNREEEVDPGGPPGGVPVGPIAGDPTPGTWAGGPVPGDPTAGTGAGGAVPGHPTPGTWAGGPVPGDPTAGTGAGTPIPAGPTPGAWAGGPVDHRGSPEDVGSPGGASAADEASTTAPAVEHPMASSPWLVSVSQHSDTVGDRSTTLAGEIPPDLSEPPSREGTGPSGEIPPPASPWWSGHPATAPTPARPAAAPPAAAPAARAATAPRRPRRSRLDAVVVALLLVGGGTLWLLAGLDVLDLGPETVLALGLVAVGVGLLVTAWRGRSYTLLPLAVVLAGALVLAEAIDVPLGAGTGDRTEVVDTAAELRTRHELLAGQLTVDLTAAPLPTGRTTEVEAAIGVGDLRVVVPRGALVEVTATTGAGEVTSPGGPEANESGIWVDTSFTLDPDVADDPDAADGGAADRRAADGGSAEPDPPRLALDLSAGMGAVEVTRG